MASGVLSSDQSWVLVNEHQNVLHAHLYFPRTEKEKKKKGKESHPLAWQNTRSNLLTRACFLLNYDRDCSQLNPMLYTTPGCY